MNGRIKCLRTFWSRKAMKKELGELLSIYELNTSFFPLNV